MFSLILAALGILQLGQEPTAFLDRLLSTQTSCAAICTTPAEAAIARQKVLRLTEQYRTEVGQSAGAQARVAGLNRLIFERFGMSADTEIDDPDNLLLTRVLERRAGYCVGLASLYLALADELGLPLYAVATPSHVFLRYDNGESRINIETFQRGSHISDEEYIRDHRIPEESVRKGVFLRNLTGKEFLAQIHNNLGVIYSKRGDYENAADQYRNARQRDSHLPAAHYNHGNDLLKQGKYRKAVRRFSKALKLYPTDAWALNNRGLAYKELGWFEEAREDFEQALAIEPGFEVARENLERLSESSKWP